MKIDGVIAMITALGCYLQNPNNGKEIFITKVSQVNKYQLACL